MLVVYMKKHAMLTPILVFVIMTLVVTLVNLAMHVHSQTTETNTTVIYIEIMNLTVYHFNTTSLSLGMFNESVLIVAYSCLYATSEGECTQLGMDIYGYNTTTNEEYPLVSVIFNSTTITCYPAQSMCASRVLVDVGNLSKIHVTVYSIPSNAVLVDTDITIPRAPKLTGYLVMLYTLIPLAIIIFFMARGNLKMTGIGAIVAGISMLVLPFIGIYTPYHYIVFVTLIVIGLIIIWVSSS